MNTAFIDFLPVFLLAISLIITLMVMLRAWPYRAKPAVKAFLWMMAALVWWLLCSFFEHNSTNLTLHVFWMNMGYVGITTLPVMWLVFTMKYVERGKWLLRRGLPLLFIVPVITMIMVWTNGQHHLMWNEIYLDTSVFPPLKNVTFNTWFWVHAVYSYVLLLGGTISLFKMYFRTSVIFRKQVRVLLLAAFVPWIANYVFIAEIGPKLAIDPTPMAFVVTGAAFIWGLSRAQLLNLMPIAYEAIFMSISEGVIVLNDKNRIQETNPAASLILQLDKAELIGKKLCQVIPRRAYSLDIISDSGLTETVVTLRQDQQQHFYRMYVSKISDRQYINGNLVLLHDDTERRKAENESREKALLKTELNERKKMQQALADSSNKLQALSEQSPVMICNVDLQGVIIYFNKKCEEVTGYSREEVLGKNGFELNTFDDDTSQLLKERMKAKIEGVRTEPIEIQYIRKDGEKIWLSMMAEPIRENNVPVGIQIIAQDVTQRRYMEQALRESEEKFSRAFRSSPQQIIISRMKDGTTVDANDSFFRISGYSREEAMNRTSTELGIWLGPEDRNKMLRILKQKGQVYNEEFQFRDKSGSIRTHLFSAEPIIVNGEECLISIMTDITERKQMEEKIRKSEERYRMIFESANDVIMLTDKKGKIIDINQRLMDIGGYDRDQLLGKNFRSLTKIMPKKSIAIVAKNFMRRVLGLNVPPYEVEMYRSNGELLNIEINAVVVKDDDKVIGTLATLRDVTERRKSESALRYQRELIDQIIATIPNAVLVINKDTEVLLANDTFYKNFRLTKKEVENKPLSEVIHAKEMEEALATMIKTKKKSLAFEFRLQIDDSESIFAAGIVKMQNQRYLIFTHDITEEREKQERLYLTDRLASVGEMASGVAHELNNPLTSIIGLSSLLTQQGASGEMQEDLVAINTEAQRCAAIVKNLLTFARKHTSMREPIQVTKILEDVLNLRSYEHRTQNITVETSFAPDLPEVLADHFQLQQVFLNIILNAEQAMVDANGRGNLKIKSEKVNGHVNISFLDDGPGISKENLGVIFNPFFTTKEVGEGTGLGLSISYGIITSHGGKIYAKSPSDKGTAFVIELPALES